MSRHLRYETIQTTPGSSGPFRYETVRTGLPSARTPRRVSSTQFPDDDPSGGIYDFKFPWEVNQPGLEFNDRGRRLRPASFDELRERQGQNLFQNFGAISRGEEGLTLRRDPITGQPIEPGRGQRNVNVGGTFNPFQTIPSFNIEATRVDVGGAQRANAQAFSAQRQAAARGAIGTFGNRLGARSGAAGLAATNQSAAPLFAAQAGANANLQAGAAFQDQRSQQAVDFRNLQTRLFGVQGQQGMLGLFQREAGQRANIGIGRGGLELGREQAKIGKEGQELRAALEKQRLGIQSFTARERAAMDRYNAYLRQQELQFRIRESNRNSGFSWGDALGIVGGIGGFFLGGPAGAAAGYQAGNAAGEWV